MYCIIACIAYFQPETPGIFWQLYALLPSYIEQKKIDRQVPLLFGYFRK